ncbi:helix-turn-helix domain-containing protein [Paenibacillus septentrionalis]|uniref:Helix-turn-helix domain-containing protein n=1 Tax=Paenibacillus septentrionalis TaxID=429342 RepID=A0ABW1UZY5_9BACL
MSNNILKLVGSKIRDLRKEKGLSQEQLGEIAGFHFSYIGGIERAEKNISLLNLAKIADALDTEIYELFSYTRLIKVSDHTGSKEDEINKILELLSSRNMNDIRKARLIIKEVFKQD